MSRVNHWHGVARMLWRDLVVRPESVLLTAAFLAVGAMLGFAKLSAEVVEGDFDGFDRWAVHAARRYLMSSADSTAVEITLNITALGGYPVLTVVVLCVLGFLLLQGSPGRALFVCAATGGGAALSSLLKLVFDRARPAVVEPLVQVTSSSFPSGHAMASAAVYLSLGSLVAATVTRRWVKLYVLSVACALTGIVGLSRILLGVHYPTDVLAGWMGGLSWALCCWVFFTLWAEHRSRQQVS